MTTFSALHHLNLFIHLSMNYSSSSHVNPYFYKQGYKLKYISWLPVPVEPRHKVIQKLVQN